MEPPLRMPAALKKLEIAAPWITSCKRPRKSGAFSMSRGNALVDAVYSRPIRSRITRMTMTSPRPPPP